MNELRALRVAAGFSQAQFAAQLGASLESYRAWDSNRRVPPAAVLDRARPFATVREDGLIGLLALSRLLSISVFRLREAARDGRLEVTYDSRAVFGRPVPRATLAAGEIYKRTYYGKRRRWCQTPPAADLLRQAPIDCALRLRAFRERERLSQRALAARLGAAGKAVVYQWETGRRRPAPQLWSRFETLERGGRP